MADLNPATSPHEETREVLPIRKAETPADASVQAGGMMSLMLMRHGNDRTRWCKDLQHIWRELDAILRGEF